MKRNLNFSNPYMTLYHTRMDELAWGIENTDLVTILSRSPAHLQDHLCDILFGNIRKGYHACVYLSQNTYFDLLRTYKHWLWKEEARKDGTVEAFKDFKEEARNLDSFINVNDDPNPNIDDIVYDAEIFSTYVHRPFVIIDDFQSLLNAFSPNYSEKGKVLYIKEGLRYITEHLLVPVIIHTRADADFNYYEKFYNTADIYGNDFPLFMPLYQITQKIFVIKETRAEVYKQSGLNAFFNWFHVKFIKAGRYIGETEYVKTNQDQQIEQNLKSLFI